MTAHGLDVDNLGGEFCRRPGKIKVHVGSLASRATWQMCDTRPLDAMAGFAIMGWLDRVISSPPLAPFLPQRGGVSPSAARSIRDSNAPVIVLVIRRRVII